MPHSRQLRLNGSESIAPRMPEFVGKTVQLILAGNEVIHGLLSTIKGDSIIVRNFRGKEIEVPIRLVNELYIDLEAV